MQALSLVTILWLVAVAAFAAVMTYRAILTQHETDELFLDDLAEDSYRKREHDDIVRRVDGLRSLVRGTVGAVGALTIAMLCVFFVQNSGSIRF